MEIEVTARFVKYEGPARCKVGYLGAFRPCGRPAEVVTIYEGSNGWRYETNPRCIADAVAIRWDVPLVSSEV